MDTIVDNSYAFAPECIFAYDELTSNPTKKVLFPESLMESTRQCFTISSEGNDGKVTLHVTIGLTIRIAERYSVSNKGCEGAAGPHIRSDFAKEHGRFFRVGCCICEC